MSRHFHWQPSKIDALPVEDLIDAFIATTFKWIDTNPELITGIGGIVVGLARHQGLGDHLACGHARAARQH